MVSRRKSKREGVNRFLIGASDKPSTGHLQPGAKDGTPKLSHGKASERRLATELGMRETLASGAISIDKGDATFGITINGQPYHGRLECKSTINVSLPVKKEWLDKIHAESVARGEVPMFSLSFVDEVGQPRDANSDWIAMPKWLMARILGVDHG